MTGGQKSHLEFHRSLASEFNCHVKCYIAVPLGIDRTNKNKGTALSFPYERYKMCVH